MDIFAYGDVEVAYLKKCDPVLGEAIDKIGRPKRRVNTDLFSAVVHIIIGQQISTVAHETIWQRLCEKLGKVKPQSVCDLSAADVQSCGMSFRKVDYIQSFAQKVLSGEFDLVALAHKTDAEIIAELSSLRGIGVWTAEMILLFCLQRADIVSFGDFGIQRGMRMLYNLPSISKEQFEAYACLYSPYGSVASFYLWAIAGGAIPDLTDPAPKLVKKPKVAKAITLEKSIISAK